jgi:tetratricopeptide (TPR) repeat protein
MLLGAIALSFAPRAFAATDDALALYRAGAYVRAAEMARAAGGAGNLVLASRAYLAQVVTEPRREDVDRLVAQALAAAERALRSAPDSVEARLQLAAAIGVKGRRMNLRTVLRAGYAPRSKKLIDEALARAPNEPWGRALLGGWHLEVLRRGGAMGALAFGARLSEGMTAFDRARALAPDDPAIATHYALALLLLNPGRFDARVRSLLDAAAACAARDAFEAHLIHEARRLDSLMRQEGALAAQREAESTFP